MPKRPNTVPQHGRKPNQKLKAYLVMRYLMKNSDIDNPVSTTDIQDFLLSDFGIESERRSIYKDIEEINKILWMEYYGGTFAEAEVALCEDDTDEEKAIVYDKSRKGFYVKQRKLELDDIRLLAECVYTAKFVPEKQVHTLIDTLTEYASDAQAESIKHDAFNIDRSRPNTLKSTVLYNLSTINEALSRKLEGRPHSPEKIRFKYMKYTVSNVKQQAERRRGDNYIVSPYRLLINDGNYYLLAFDDRYQEIRTYRVDRMKDVQRTGEPRDGEVAFNAVDWNRYTQRTFSMFSGKTVSVTMRFINPLLDTVVDRFGTKDVSFAIVDDRHFTLTAPVDISPQFFGWLLGFGKRAKLIAPDFVVEEFTAYIEKVQNMYEKPGTEV